MSDNLYDEIASFAEKASVGQDKEAALLLRFCRISMNLAERYGAHSQVVIGVVDRWTKFWRRRFGGNPPPQGLADAMQIILTEQEN